jgi:ATP-dependent DNA helicase RecG
MAQLIKQDLTLPIQYIKGIGPKRAEAFAKHDIITVSDLLYYFPYDYFDLTEISSINSLRRLADSGKRISAIGEVRAIDVVGRPPKRRCVIILGDDTGTIPLVFFQNANYFKSTYKIGETIAISGKINSFMNRPQIVHPRIDRLEVSDDNDLKGFLHTKGIISKYSSNEDFKLVNINETVIRKIFREVVDRYAPMITEVIPESILTRNQLIPLPEAIRSIHFPETIKNKNDARTRLKFNEWFFYQMLLAYRKKRIKIDLPGISFKVESKLARSLVDSLSFRLTQAQVRVINQIAEDMHQPKPMNRLLQGDVGSGKTIVALIAMLIAIDNGYQVAFMAPTEILAEQHYKTLTQFLKDLPVNIRLLLGGQKRTLRQDVLEDIRRGSANIVVGTHALIQEKVEFANVGLIIIDEQHRFGVAQRAELMRKGKESLTNNIVHKDINIHPDVLVMTATPIPRTLSLTVYGDLDVSIIDEMPKDRRQIKTTMITESNTAELYQMIKATIKKSQQVYIVYPLIEESENSDLKAAVESYEMLRSEVFPDRNIGLIHGRMSSEEKDAVMEDFKKKKLDMLVSTTVIEVGIDIPNATLMVVEHAERFGLSQLHQLRGRVGRGAQQSHCILVVPDWMSRVVKRKEKDSSSLGFDNSMEINELERQHSLIRIQTMLETTDGFKIAEVDLKLRGPGDFFGTKQSGMPELHIANILEDGPIISDARREAFSLVESDPHLRSPENQSIRKYFSEKLKDSLAFIQVG